MSDNLERQIFISNFLDNIEKPSDKPIDPPDEEIIPEFKEDDEILDLDNVIDINKFQIVRREFFAHTREPAICFNNCQFYANAACLSKFPTADYVQVLVNQETKIIALRPCNEGERDSFQWCRKYKGKRVPKHITCKLFFAKIFALMDWNPDYRYKLLGRYIHSNGLYLIAFDLTSTEVYQKRFEEGAKPKASKTPVFPLEWQNQFGLNFNDHHQSMQINIFDGYAVYAIKDNTKKVNNGSSNINDAAKKNNNVTVNVNNSDIAGGNNYA